jgi:hypothetical protein
MQHGPSTVIALKSAVLVFCLFALAAAVPARQQPAFLFEPMLDTYFDDRSGLIVFHAAGYDLAFPPGEPLNAAVAVVDDSNTVVASFPLDRRYANRTSNGAIARTVMDGTAELALTEPGVYNIVWMIDGAPVSRLPVVLERVETGDDPFDRETHLRYFGLWQRYAHISMDRWNGEEWPALTFWAGIRDFDEPAHQLPFFVEMTRDGDVVAHSKRTQGSIPYKHYRRVEAHLYHPHDRQSSPNAEPFLADDWTRDGDYEITVTRTADGRILRSFAFTARGGTIQPLAEARPGHEPPIDYRPPRVRDKSSTGYDFVEAIWIKPKD